MNPPNGKAFLMILDGYGVREERGGNAVKLADTPYLHQILGDGMQTTLSASGRDVGLPDGLMGNSEVGHLNLGAGRIIYQEISRIDTAIESGEFFTNQALNESADHALKNGSAWHLIGLVSNGGVHSSLEHLYALLELANRKGLRRVFLHALTDGRDTPPHSGGEFIRQVEAKMREVGVGRIATICGRYWGMDRDKRWQRTERAYRMLTAGEGLRFDSAEEAVVDSYHREVTDEFIEPSVVLDEGEPTAVIADGDAVLFFNFRADRARQMTLALTQPDFDAFPRERLDLHYSTMTLYREDFDLPVAFPPEYPHKILGEVVSRAGLKQFRIAETEKYAHVTFFFNGGSEEPFEGEERMLVQSPKVATYDLQPEMSAPEVARHAAEALDRDYAFILLNFANPDMVGHTGFLPAVIQALETLDPLVKSLVEKALKRGYAVFITADHGNCELMVDRDGGPFTAHTTNPVPVALFARDGSRPRLRQGGRLADVAPTILNLMGLPAPSEMTGQSLLKP